MFDIDWHDADEIRYVVASGELDLTSIQQLVQALQFDDLEVDMTGVTFLESTTVGVMLEAQSRARSFHLTTGPAVAGRLDAWGLGDQFSI